MAALLGATACAASAAQATPGGHPPARHRVGSAAVTRHGAGSPAATTYTRWGATLVQSLEAASRRTVGVSPRGRVSRTGSSPSFPLSNERTLTTWANPARRTAVYAAPGPAAHRQLSTLHMYTEDGFPEVYVLLAERIDGGRAWIRLRFPGRPNGQTGWVRRSALGPFEQTHWLLVIDRRRERLTAYWNGRPRLVAPVGIGKPSTPTPAGLFWIRERFRILDPASPYWPFAMGTSDYSTLTDWPGGGVIGLHGDWGQPWLIPGRPSHGCIRMHNRDIAWLAPRVTVGTPIRVT